MEIDEIYEPVQYALPVDILSYRYNMQPGRY